MLDYRKLQVWQKAHEFALEVYKITEIQKMLSSYIKKITAAKDYKVD